MESAKSEIWVFVEQRRGRLAEVGFELMGKALALAEIRGMKTAAVIAGSGLSELSEEVLSCGVDEVLVVDHPLLEDYCNQTYVKALDGMIREWRPQVFLIGATALGTDLAPRLAARLRTGLSAHCVDLCWAPDGGLVSVVPGWRGNLLACVTCPRTRPQVATVMPGVFGLPEPVKPHGCVIPVDCRLEPEDVTYRVVEMKQEEPRKSGLETAEVVVAGGWGVGGKSEWRFIEQLASAFNGAVGATRPPVDEGWAHENQMIGQSGRTVHPRLYIGVGISGHMHHMVGIKGADMMVVINSDPSAPVFGYGDLGLVGDFRDIVPALIKAVRAYSGAGGE